MIISSNAIQRLVPIEVKIVNNENFIQKEEFYFQVGDGESDHSYWGRAEEMKMHRPSYKITPNKVGIEISFSKEHMMRFNISYFEFLILQANKSPDLMLLQKQQQRLLLDQLQSDMWIRQDQNCI